MLDRVATIEDGATTLVTYQYSGAGAVVTQTYNEPGFAKTIALGSGSNPYSALDRFGRLIDLRWSGTRSTTELVKFEYDYDRVSNRLNERNLIDGSHGSNPAMDRLFGYDELNRLTSFKTGQLNTGGDAITSPTMTQAFTLDETGNFAGFTQTLVNAVTQTRDHSKANEITDTSESVGKPWATPAHDVAGNMTSIPQPADLSSNYDATWDAWNRLVKLEDGTDTVAVYQYDGANRRIVKSVYSAGSLDESRHVYYSSSSQALEERVDSSSDTQRQFVWNLGYVDDLVLRDRDTTSNGTLDERLYSLSDMRYSVMAMANASGTVVERFAYDAYGSTSVMDSLFVSRSSSNYDWEFRYTGSREDLETGLYYFRARYYSAHLGRFISRDPLGFVDGMSLYRAYFVPGGVDPFGLFTQEDGSDTIPIPPGESGVGGICIVVDGICIRPQGEVPGGPIIERPLGPHGKQPFDDLYRKANSLDAMLSRLRRCELRHPIYFCKEDFNWNSTRLTSIEAILIARCNERWGAGRRKRCRDEVKKSIADQRKKLKADYEECLELTQQLIDDGITEVPFNRDSCFTCGSFGFENHINRLEERKRRKAENEKKR